MGDRFPCPTGIRSNQSSAEIKNSGNSLCRFRGRAGRQVYLPCSRAFAWLYPVSSTWWMRWAGLPPARDIKQDKGIWWMPWRQEAMKDVVLCDKLRGAENKL